MSTPGCCPCSHQCAEVWPWPRGCGRVPFPSFPGDPAVFAVPAAGLSVDLASAHPHLHMGTWICILCELRGGTDWTECVWQLPDQTCSYSKAILCGEVPPDVSGGCFPSHSSATMAAATFFCCSWKVFKAPRPTEGWYSWLWLLTCVCLLILVGSPMVLKHLEPFCQEDVSSVIS